MSASKKLHPDEKIKADKLGGQLFKAGAGAGIVLMVLSVVLGAAHDGQQTLGLPAGADKDNWRHFFAAYLTAWSFVTSLCVGALFFIVIHTVARARAFVALRRIAEFMVGAFPVVFLLGLGFVIPILAGSDDVYFWTNDALHDTKHPFFHHLHHKFGWLDPFFFAGRYVFYFAVYIGVSRYFVKQSARQDVEGDNGKAERMRVWSGVSILVSAIVTIFAAMDWFMSSAPMWYSTIYAVNWFAGAMLGTYCTIGLLALVIQRSGRLTHSVTTEHYHDIGKYMFGWTFFWIYTAFSQFMLQWYGNMPEETVFYNYRMFGQWSWLSIVLLLGHWAFPYTSLLSRWTKRVLPLFAFFAAWQLVFHYIDLYWNLMPHATWTMAADGVTPLGPLQGEPELHKINFSAMDLTLLFGMVGLWIAGVGKAMRGNLIPVNDPKLPEALAFENY